MIRDSTVFYKLISIYSLKDIDLFNRAILEFNPHHCTCPLCGAKHACISTSDAYERYLISYENQQVVVRTLSISMILCTSCKKSHAVLPLSLFLLQHIVSFSSFVSWRITFHPQNPLQFNPYAINTRSPFLPFTDGFLFSKPIKSSGLVF